MVRLGGKENRKVSLYFTSQSLGQLLSEEGVFQKWTATVNGRSQLGKEDTNSEEIVNSY